MSSEVTRVVTTPLGPVALTVRDGGLAAVAFCVGRSERTVPVAHGQPDPAPPDVAVLRQAERQLGEYFAGVRTAFDLPINLSGCSPFSRRVLVELCAVPYGTTLTYGELAAKAGAPRAARAVGRVMAGNPLPIVVPCHRVLAAGGKLGGYSGGCGIPTKEWLLAFEHGNRQSC